MKSKLRFIGIILFVQCAFFANAQNWDEIIKATASDRNANDFYGKAVAIDGDYAIVGAWGEDEDVLGNNTMNEAGSAYILHLENGRWIEVQKIVASDRYLEDNFGYSVDICGDYAVVGAWKESHNETGDSTLQHSGSVYIFYNDGNSWSQTQKIVALDRTESDFFGNSVAIDGDFIVVGAMEDDINHSINDNAGSAYIFLNTAGNWIQTQKIVASDRSAADYFGYDVDISGDFIIVGALFEDEDEDGLTSLNSAGSAYIFEYTSSWNQVKKITATDREADDYFGYSVAIDGNYAIVGAYEKDLYPSADDTIPDAGAAYTFSCLSGGIITPLNKLVASDREIDDRFGNSVAIDGDYAIVGAYLNDVDALGENFIYRTGSAYIFNITSGLEEQKIVALDRDVADYFGCAVAISNDYLIVGAILEDHDNNGNNTQGEAGSAYIFHNRREINVKQAEDIADEGIFDFGEILWGNSSSELTFTIENTGVDNLILSGSPFIEISGADAAKFTINQTLTSTPVTAGSSTTFTISFNPTAAAVYTAEISILNNDTDENPYNFTIIGTGSKHPQTITDFATISTKTYGDNNFNVSATASSGLDVVFSSSDENIATCGGTNGEIITIIGAGTCDIYANQLGNEFYEAAPQISQTLIVNQKHLTVTTDLGQTKEYGNSEPVFTYTLTTGSLVSGDSFSGALSRTTGEDLGVYEISIGTLSAGANYSISFINADFEIIERTIYVTVDADQSKVVGQTDPGLTYSYYPTLVDDDSFIGTISRLAGEDVGFYEIQQGTLSLNSNYIIDYTSNNFEITQKHITVTPNSNLSKIYGTTDPYLTYTYSPALASGDTFTGTLVRETGEDVGLYAITAGTLSAGNNYSLNIESENMEIIQKSIIIVPLDNQSKSYGNLDPLFTYYNIGSPVNGDELTGALSRTAGENLGFYEINLGTLSIGSNYNLTINPKYFEIKRKNILIIVDADQSKVYGEADPILTYTPSSSIATWDSYTGSIVRESGENAGTYAINQGSLALNSNYNLSFMGDDFEITRIPITLTADAGQSKYYGEDNPDEYTYSYTGNIVNGDSFSGALTRDYGENVGMYTINQGGLWISTNYLITYIANDFEIIPSELEVIADANQSKEYGDMDPAEYTYSYTGTLSNGDDFTGTLSRIDGEDIGFYEINQGSLTINNNYNLSFITDNFEITTKTIAVTIDPDQSKVYGEADHDLTYTYTGTLASGDDFTGVLFREIGENVGLYPIEQGTLSLNENYNININSENFEITKANPILTWNNPADIYHSTELTETQLNAVADVAGSFSYGPDFGFVLPVGDNQELTCEFTPTDNVNYNIVSASAFINVLLDSKVETYFTDLKVYPNPTRGILFIDFGESTDAKIKILDITGKIILEKSVNNTVETLDMSMMPSGVYFVEIETVTSATLSHLSHSVNTKRMRVVVQ